MLYFSQKRMKGSVTQERHFVSKSGKCLSKWFANHDDQAAMDSVGNDRRETHEKREALSRSAQMEGWTVEEQPDCGDCGVRNFVSLGQCIPLPRNSTWPPGA